MKRTRYPGVYRRGDSYVAVVTYKDGNRERQKWITAKGLTEVRELRDDFKQQLRRGFKPATNKRTLESFLREIWLPYVQATDHALTFKNAASLVRNHLIPVLGQLKLAEIDAETLAQFYRTRTASTGRNCETALSSAFRLAVKKGYVNVNPVRLVDKDDRPKYKRKEPKHLEPDEARRMLSEARGDPIEGAVLVGLAGLRIGEAIALSWSDIVTMEDKRTGKTLTRLHVRRSFWGSTKSGEERSFILPESTAAALRRFRLSQAEQLLKLGIRQDESMPIVVNAWGQPMTPQRMTDTFRAFCRAHAFDVTYHSLRHTAASLMVSAGIDPKTVSTRLGHASAAFTLQVYARTVKAADEAAAETLDAVYSE